MKKIRVGKNEYEINKWSLDGRRKVMDRFFLDTATAQSELKGDAIYVSYSVCIFAIQEGTRLTDDEIDSMPDEDIVKLGTEVFTFNDKKKLTKSNSKSTVGSAEKVVVEQTS